MFSGAIRGLRPGVQQYWRGFCNEPCTVLDRWLQGWQPTKPVAGAPASLTALQWLRQQRPDVPDALLHRLFRGKVVRQFDPSIGKITRVSKSHPLAPGTLLLLPNTLAPACEAPGNVGPAAATAPAAPCAGAATAAASGTQKLAAEGAYAQWGTAGGAVGVQPRAAGVQSRAAAAPPARRAIPEHWLSMYESLMRGHLLYEDGDLLMLNKPPGLAVQGGPGIHTSLDRVLAAGSAARGLEAPRLVHRLDKGTSGVLVVARHAPAAAWLAESFRDKGVSGSPQAHDRHVGARVAREYWAVVRGPQSARAPREGTICLPVASRKAAAASGSGAGRRSWQARTGGLSAPAGAGAGAGQLSEAVTEYLLLESSHGVAWLALWPLTGRKHQLRMHCAAGLGMPIVGDPKYGEPPNQLPWDLQRQVDERMAALASSRQEQQQWRRMAHASRPQHLCLHARSLRVVKSDGSVVCVTADLPDHMQTLFQCLAWTTIAAALRA